MARRSFDGSTQPVRGIGSLGMQALSHCDATEESKNGVRTALEKRKPAFRR